MSEIISFPLPVGPNYTIPDPGDENWGQAVTSFLVSIPSGVVPTAGTFNLTGDLSFGTSFGLVIKYLVSQTMAPATSGFLRLAKSDGVIWRNNANSANLVLTIDGSDNLTFNGSTFGISGAVNPGTANTLSYYATSTDAVSGLTAITPSRALASDSNGLPVASSVTATELGYVSGVTSSIQAQINAIEASTIWGPIGSSLLYSSATSPSANYVQKDGRAVSRTTYAALFALIGTTFGVGDGTTTFNIPNATDVFPVGAGNLYTLGQTGGAIAHTLTNAEIPTLTVTDPGHTHTQDPHSHSVNDPGHDHIMTGATATGATNFSVARVSYSTTPPAFSNLANSTAVNTTGLSVNNTTATNDSATTGISVTGGGLSHSILNPFLAEYWFYRII